MTQMQDNMCSVVQRDARVRRVPLMTPITDE